MNIADRNRKILKAVTLEIRHLLEGAWSADGLTWRDGDLGQRLHAIGVRSGRAAVPVDELQLSTADREARRVVDAYVATRAEAGVDAASAVGEFIRETAYTWANRLLAIRCMEVRGVVDDEVVLTKTVYAGRSMLHNRLVHKRPELEQTEDGGLFAALGQAFAELAERLPRAFDPATPGVALRPSITALKTCIALLSGTQAARGQEPAEDAVFHAPDALGWAYQYWNTEEKQRVFDAAGGKGPDRKRHKIEGADIVSATQLYTEPYMVKYLVQNSLGALWACMHPDTALTAGWGYFVVGADRAPVAPRAPDSLTVLDPACGSGHFLLEAFDVLFAMYREAEPERPAGSIATSILTKNLHGIDIDQRAVEITEIALWMKAAECFENPCGFCAPEMNLVATNLRLPRAEPRPAHGTEKPPNAHLTRFLAKHPDDAPLKSALEIVFEGLEHADELGALLLIEEPVERELRRIKAAEDRGTADRTADPQGRLFRAGEQTALPLALKSFDEWRWDVLERLQSHFAEEATQADLVQAFFGKAVSRALGLFDLLSIRYDVVTANPPYMGSKNMGPVVRKYVEQHFQAGKRDLYAAFILRCQSLLAPGGREAIVAPDAWLFMRSYAAMRALLVDPEKRVFTGILAETSVETVAQLGRHAFSEADPPGNVAMFVLRSEPPSLDHRPACFRLALPRPAEEQARLLALGVAGKVSGLVWRPNQRAFLDVPQAPFSYWLRPRILQLFAGSTLSTVGEVRQGTATAADPRFLRFVWELGGDNGRWFPFYKGGGYRKWDGLASVLVDWERSATRLRAFPGSVIRSPDAYFKPGWTYSLMSRGRMSVRCQSPAAVIGHKGPGIYLRDDRFVAALNSRTFSHILRGVSPSLSFEVDVTARGPVPDLPPDVDVRSIVAAKSRLSGTDLAERYFVAVADLQELLEWSAELHVLEGDSERIVMAAYGLDEADIASVIADTGTPAGWLPDEATAVMLDRLRLLFEAGPGGSVDGDESDDDADDEEEEEEAVTTGRPIHPETFLEEMCEKAGISPRAALREIIVGIEKGWRCRREEGRIAADRVTELVLRLLSHQWPLDVERGDPVPPWADGDGIVPLTYIPGEVALPARVRERLSATGDVIYEEAILADALGCSLDSWLNLRFFSHHVSQFRKRPPAWQIQSGSFTPRRSPGFACLVYAQRLNADTLSRIRSQYVGPWKDRLDSERRTLDGLSGRSPDQSVRLGEVDQTVRELLEFEAKLRAVEGAGFATPDLTAIAVQDALQSLTKPLLARFQADLAPDEAAWREEAAAIDESLAVPLSEALRRIPLACARAVRQQLAALATQRKARKEDEREELAPIDGASARAFVVTYATALLGVAIAEVTASWEREFAGWAREQRDLAVAAGRRPPKLKEEKAAARKLVDRISRWQPVEAGVAEFIQALPLLDRTCGQPGRPIPTTLEEFIAAEGAYRPDVNDGVRVNIAPLQRADLLGADVLVAKDILPAIADRAIWRADERRWVREGRLPQPGWWPKEST
jgi:hypothetical protein